METTKLGTEEQERFTLRPSAKSTMRFPLKIEINPNLPLYTLPYLGQMMWSTWDRTFSQTSSLVFRLNTSISVLLWPMLQTMQPFFILSMLSRVTTFLFPVAVITISTRWTTSASFTTWKANYGTWTQPISNVIAVAPIYMQLIDLKTIHASLKRTDRVNLSDIDHTPIKYVNLIYACNCTIMDETQMNKERPKQ